VTSASPTTRERRARFGLLLGFIAVAFAIEGIASPNEWQGVLITALLGATLLLALWAADAKPRFLRLGAVIVVAVVAVSVVEAVNGNPSSGAMRVANALLVLLAPPVIVAGVVRILRAKQAVTLEAVFGVLSVYILVGMLFGFIFGAIDRFGGNPFFAGGQPATVAHCLYFSYTTLTTVGYGDLTARTNLGHTLSVSEALLGQIYLVTIVSLIVANLGRSRPAVRPSTQAKAEPERR
jgi:hypothetical protein